MTTHERQQSVSSFTNPLTMAPSNKIGPWKLGTTLGAGSTGKVVLAVHERTGMKAAVKVVSKSILSHSEQINGLPYGIEREIIIMKLLNHPNVLRLYDVWETSKNLYMVLEYVEGGELFNLLVDRGPLDEREAVKYFRQIIIGASYCHALGICHRDLKPENLLLDGGLNVKLADFGMAALESKDKMLETSCGSPHYAAPEIVSGLPYHGFESDVWSCGVILFALLTGRLPFDDDDGNIRNLLLKVQKGVFEMPSTDEISPQAQDLLSKILVVDPEERIKTRDILKHPLLLKYPSMKDSKSIRNLPAENTYLKPIGEVLDDMIVENLTVLWHGRSKQEIIDILKAPGPAVEKTFYGLLQRFKNNESAGSTDVSDSTASRTTVRHSILGPGEGFTPKKKRTSIIVSSSSRKSLSFHTSASSSPSKRASVPPSPSKNPTLSPSKRNSMMASSPSKRLSHTPSPSKRISRISVSPNKRNSKIITPSASSKSNRSSVSPSKRGSKQFVLDKYIPPTPTGIMGDYVAPKKKRLSLFGGKGGSITTKLIATYTKLTNDDEWEYIDKETKRTSKDFATLCDEIFEYEKFEAIRQEKAELERKLQEAKRNQELERRRIEEAEIAARAERERLAKEEADRLKAIEEEAEKIKNDMLEQEEELRKMKEEMIERQKRRSVSEPMRQSVIIDKAARDITEMLNQRTSSMNGRPISRLDPGLYSSKPVNVEATVNECIRRSKFLGSSFSLYQELQGGEESPSIPPLDFKKKRETMVIPEDEELTTVPLPLNSNVVPRKISDIQVPQFTRQSKHFSASRRRLSVLSLYSSQQSYTNLADQLKGKEPEALNSPRVHQNPSMMKTSYSQRFKQPKSMIADTVNEEQLEIENNQEKQRVQSSGLQIYADDSPTPSKKTPRLEPEPKMEPELLDVPEVPKVTENQPEATAPAKPALASKNTVSKTPLPPAKDSLPLPKKRDTVSEAPVEKLSFFRKLSFGKKVPEKDQILNSSIDASAMHDALSKLLLEWTQYGVKDVQVLAASKTIMGKLSSENILSLRSTAFKIQVKPYSGEGSSIVFSKLSGSKKTFSKLTNEIHKILNKEGVLV